MHAVAARRAGPRATHRRCDDRPPASPGSREPDPEAHRWRARAEIAAMRRAIDLAASPGVPLGPNPRVGGVAAGRRRGDGRRGLPPRRRSPHAEVDALTGRRAGPRCHRRRHARAVQPHRPDRTVRRGPDRGRRDAASSFAQPDLTRSPQGGAAAAARPGSTSRRACWPTRPRAINRALDLRPRPPPTVRDLEVRHHARRSVGRRRRHRRSGSPAAPPAPTSTGCAPSATRSWSAPARSLADDPQLTVRDDDDAAAAARPAAAARRGGPARPARRRAGLRRRGRDPVIATHDPAVALEAALRQRPPACLARGRADLGRRVPAGRPGRRGRRLRRAGAARRRPTGRRRTSASRPSPTPARFTSPT